MSSREAKPAHFSAETLGLKLLQSVREMKAGKFARVTEVPVNAVVEARQGRGCRRPSLPLR